MGKRPGMSFKEEETMEAPWISLINLGKSTKKDLETEPKIIGLVWKQFIKNGCSHYSRGLGE
jgi:hypothetical protein